MDEDITPDDIASAQNANRVTDEILVQLEDQLGEDIIPYIIIMVVKVAITHGLDINWVCRSIQIGFYNEDGPQNFQDKIDSKGNVVFDS